MNQLREKLSRLERSHEVEQEVQARVNHMLQRNDVRGWTIRERRIALITGACVMADTLISTVTLIHGAKW